MIIYYLVASVTGALGGATAGGTTTLVSGAGVMRNIISRKADDAFAAI
jgi:hypothetical protein